jgi:hypothetical protein
MTSTILGLCFFIVPIWTYKKGLEQGLAVVRDKPLPPLMKSPVKAIKEAKEERQLTKEEKEKQEELQEWLQYGGDVI